MNFLCWNVCEIEGEGKVGTIAKLVRLNRVKFIGLVETQCSEFREQKLEGCGMWMISAGSQ